MLRKDASWVKVRSYLENLCFNKPWDLETGMRSTLGSVPEENEKNNGHC